MGRNCGEEINQCLSMSCENNSTCVRVSTTQYKCHCAEGYTGSQCEFLQVVNFDRVSFIALPSAANRKNYSMVFSIITSITGGVVFYQGKVSSLFIIMSIIASGN